MFIPTPNELHQFVSSILDLKFRKEVLTLLHSEDEKQISYAKNSMIDKMPKELQPQSTSTPFINTEPTPFPSMFLSTNKKTYEYIDQNLQNMKQIANSYCQPKPSSVIKNTLLPQVEQLPKNQSNLSGEIDADDEAKPQKTVNISQRIKSSNSQMSLSFNQSKPLRNPFVANSINFTDNYANSKALENKYQHLTFSENSRNITAIAQTAKYTAFSNSVAFPTTVMTGNILPPKENTFSRESKLDIQDVMRYTLGAKRTSVSKSEVQNPFLRAPKRRT